MTKVPILGVSGQIARRVVSELAHDNRITMTLYVHDTRRLSSCPAGAPSLLPAIGTSFFLAIDSNDPASRLMNCRIACAVQTLDHS